MKQLDLTGEVYVAPPRGYHGELPVPSTIYLVATWYGPDDRWKIWSQNQPTREEAEKLARDIGLTVRGHTHYTVIQIELPGIGS